MNTYDFICKHLERDYPDSIPVMDEYLTAWLKDDDGVDITKKFSGDLATVIYPYLAAYQALCDSGVEDAESTS